MICVGKGEKKGKVNEMKGFFFTFLFSFSLPPQIFIKSLIRTHPKSLLFRTLEFLLTILRLKFRFYDDWELQSAKCKRFSLPSVWEGEREREKGLIWQVSENLLSYLHTILGLPIWKKWALKFRLWWCKFQSAKCLVKMAFFIILV